MILLDCCLVFIQKRSKCKLNMIALVIDNFCVVFFKLGIQPRPHTCKTSTVPTELYSYIPIPDYGDYFFKCLFYVYE